ncbi:MAG: polyprenyl synthetase family protein [Spirochaetes bacterium]|nr:polyprenyl synthetase family protein [Spirochaetota bacterium]
MTDFWNGSPAMGKKLAEVESILISTIDDPAYPLAEETKALVLSGGKMLRPAFVLIGAGFGAGKRSGGRSKKIPHIAAAVELLHTATLIHDDILDDADFRRGTPALHTKFGTVDAILAGDWLFSSCFRLMADYADAKSARILSRFVGAICSSEIRQDLGKFTFSTSKREYLRTIAGKTAALFSLSLHVGASEAKADVAVTQALRRAGYDIGMAFQIIDDILDYESDDLTLKKPVGNDLKEGLCTLPLIFALEEAPGGLKPLLGAGRMDDARVALILDRVRETKGLDRAREVARSFTARARKEIGTLPDYEAKAFEEMLRYFLVGLALSMDAFAVSISAVIGGSVLVLIGAKILAEHPIKRF